MVKAYIFDFDDTLSDRQKSTYYKYKNFLKDNVQYKDEFELEAMVQDIILFDERGNSRIRSRIESLYNKYHLDETIIDKFYDYWYELEKEVNYLFDDTIETLIELKNRGYKLGIITNGKSSLQHRKIECTNIEHLFDEIIVSSDLNTRKPDPEIYQVMAQKLGLKCEECVFVGDTFSTDILGAHRANMIPILMFTDTYRVCDLDILRITNMKDLLTLQIK